MTIFVVPGISSDLVLKLTLTGWPTAVPTEPHPDLPHSNHPKLSAIKQVTQTASCQSQQW